jgi:hypothetical protein
LAYYSPFLFHSPILLQRILRMYIFSLSFPRVQTYSTVLHSLLSVYQLLFPYCRCFFQLCLYIYVHRFVIQHSVGKISHYSTNYLSTTFVYRTVCEVTQVGEQCCVERLFVDSINYFSKRSCSISVGLWLPIQLDRYCSLFYLSSISLNRISWECINYLRSYS